MPPSNAATALPPPVHAHWLHGVLVHGLRTVVVGVAVALFITLVGGGDFWRNLVYAECISLACWLFIDGGRVAVALVKYRAVKLPTTEGQNLWPGWGWMTACLLVGTLCGVTLGAAAGDWLTGRNWNGMNGNGLRQLVSLLAFSILPGAGFSYYYYSQQKLRAAEAQAELARRQAAEHQLKLLESQLEPHMLFNTLANLRVLIALDAPRAQAMLDQLIAFLRATLSGSRAQQHALADEFARLGDYLALMQVRMGERLQFGFELPAELAALPVPPMVLQPLVENSIKHGLEPKVEGGRITVSAALDGGSLRLCVRDTGCGPSGGHAGGGEGTHFGLQQVRERLTTLYGSAATLTLDAVDDAAGGTLATVRLPCPGGALLQPAPIGAAAAPATREATA